MDLDMIGDLFQMILLQKALDIHGAKAPESLQPFHAHLEERFTDFKRMSEKDFNIKVTSKSQFS